MFLFGIFSEIVSFLVQRNDDDGFDRLNHRWTTGLLILFAVLVTTKTYVRDAPITCWAPKEFSSSWEKYVNSYCWVSNTYYIPFGSHLPRSSYVRQKSHPIIYYQWVPLILLVQAFMFYAPVYFWRALNNKTGIDVNDIVETAEKYQFSLEHDTKQKVMYHLLSQMNRSLERSAPTDGVPGPCKDGSCRPNCKWIIQNYICCICNQRFGNYLVVLYFLLKVVFIVNSVGQIFLLNRFLGQDFGMYGYEVMAAAFRGDDWTESPRFPRVTMCDVEIRRLGNIHQYTLQCVLPVNMYNERVYLFIWFWLLILTCLTCVNLFVWVIRFGCQSQRKLYVLSNLKKSSTFDCLKRSDQELIDGFVEDYLRSDGILVLRLVDINTSKVIMQDFVSNLWERYRLTVTPRRRRLLGHVEESV